MIIQSKMSHNRIFVIPAIIRGLKEEDLEVNQIRDETNEEIWHKRFGHLSLSSLVTLGDKDMVVGLPKITQKGEVCEICLKEKQVRANITKALELVHSDICGPISPVSESGK